MDNMEDNGTMNDAGQAVNANPAENPAPGVAPAISPEELADLKTRAAKAEENWSRLLRATADFDNFKKRAAREKDEAHKFATESLMKKLVPVLDNFEAALAAASQNTAAKTASFQSGVSMIYQQLRSSLLESGLEEIDATGKPFDPNWHEAVSQQDSAELPEGQVVMQLRKGFKLRERLLRPATVIVSRKPAA